MKRILLPEQISRIVRLAWEDRTSFEEIQKRTGFVERGVGKIHMIGGHIQHCLLLEIFTNAGIGTDIVPD